MKFIEVTVIEKGREPQRALIDLDRLQSVTEIVEHRLNSDLRINVILVLAYENTTQPVTVAETFNEIRNRLTTALS